MNLNRESNEEGCNYQQEERLLGQLFSRTASSSCGEFFVNIDTDMLKIIDSKNGSSLHYNAENQTYLYLMRNFN